MFSDIQYKQYIIKLKKLWLSAASPVSLSVFFSILKTYQAMHGRYMWYALKNVTLDTLAELRDRVCGWGTAGLVFYSLYESPFCVLMQGNVSVKHKVFQKRCCVVSI